MKPKTLSIGGATFDVFLRMDSSTVTGGLTPAFSLPLGAKIKIPDVLGSCGGGANNTATGLARLGCDAAFSGVIGDDEWGQLIRQTMEKEGVDTQKLTVIEGEPSSFAVILLAPTGERTILTHKSMDRHFHDVTFDREAMKQADAVYLNHIHKDSSEIENDIVDILTDTPRTHLTWNPGGYQIEAGLREKNIRLLVSHTDVLLLNREEALAFSGGKTVLEALHLLIGAGASVVCITDGPKGSIATDGKTLYSCPVPPCTVLDTTGAGDSFGTAMTWAILTGKDLPTALKAGTINAMSVVGVIGAQGGLLTETQIQTELTKTDIAVTAEAF